MLNHSGNLRFSKLEIEEGERERRIERVQALVKMGLNVELSSPQLKDRSCR